MQIQKKKIGNQKFDEIKYITEDTFYWLSDERFRKYYETRWIYKFKDTVVNVNKHRKNVFMGLLSGITMAFSNNNKT